MVGRKSSCKGFRLGRCRFLRKVFEIASPFLQVVTIDSGTYCVCQANLYVARAILSQNS